MRNTTTHLTPLRTTPTKLLKILIQKLIIIIRLEKNIVQRTRGMDRNAINSYIIQKMNSNID